jgi:hypothetical protein
MFSLDKHDDIFNIVKCLTYVHGKVKKMCRGTPSASAICRCPEIIAICKVSVTLYIHVV